MAAKKKALEGELCFKGASGKSDYELAVKNGYTGTLQEWLNSHPFNANNYIQIPDIQIIEGEYTEDFPGVWFYLELPEGFNETNTKIICIKVKRKYDDQRQEIPEAQRKWELSPFRHYRVENSFEEYEGFSCWISYNPSIEKWIVNLWNADLLLYEDLHAQVALLRL